MKNMESFMAVNENTDGIIGKFFYYSTSKILIRKDEFINVGMSFGLPKYKPAKESKSGAYRNATTAIKDRVTVKDATGTHVYRIYCRDNKKETENAERICRELVKETLESRTNEYKKLANIIFDKQTETVYFENEVFDPDVDVTAYCEKARELFELYCDCYTSDQVDAVITDMLDRMQANEISIHGKLFFIPNPNLPLLNVLEDYIEAISQHNLSDGLVMSNSMFVVDDEKQRKKMTEEFYANYKRDIEFYQNRIQNLIENGCDSKTIIDRWLKKVSDLQKKKALYEDVLKQQLDALNSDYAVLQMQSQELLVRSNGGHAQMQFAA